MSRLLGLAAAASLCASSSLMGGALAQTASLEGSFEGAPAWLSGVYEDRGYQPVWSDGDRPSAAYRALVRSIEEAEARGLDTSMYALDSIKALASESVAVREQGAALMFARYAQDLLDGRTDRELEYQPDFAQLRERGRAGLLAAAYEAGDPMDYLAARTPDNFLVERLTDALGRYRRIAERGGWDALPTDVVVEPGESDEAIPAIRERLVAEGFHAGPSRGPNGRMTATEANDEFVAALRAFQRSRSIADDGVVGPDTLAALNETPEQLIQRLEVNIERARWLPEDMGDLAAFVNAADFKLRVYEGGALAFQMPVIVGEARTQTPVFADTMESVVVNPYWNVPSSILIGEIAPAQLDDPGYATRKNFEVLRGGQVVSPSSVDWQAAANGNPSFRVRQTAGDHNALGRIKFLFPNKYAVYLHDTPADSLFGRDVRTFSHGCIRIAEPVRFGAWLLDMDQSQLQRMIDSEERTEIPSPATPVYIAYFTAWAEPDGQVTFARDVYDRDAKVAEALDRGA